MEFPKYTKLPSELRRHVVSYNDYKTLPNYAACSKLCNEEVQKTYIYFPENIEIRDKMSTGVVVTLDYEEPRKMSCRMKFTTVDGNKHQMDFWNSSESYTYDGNAHQAAVEYIENRLKYARIGKPTLLMIDVKTWPTGLMDVHGIEKYGDWVIAIRESMYQGFYESVVNHPIQNVRLTLLQPYIGYTKRRRFIMPAQFFETDFFQNLATLDGDYALLEMSEDSFLALKAREIEMNISKLSVTAINQKISQWLANPPTTQIKYQFRDYNRGLKSLIDDILVNLPVKREEEGRYRFHLVHKTGVKATIEIVYDTIVFKTNS